MLYADVLVHCIRPITNQIHKLAFWRGIQAATLRSTARLLLFAAAITIGGVRGGLSQSVPTADDLQTWGLEALHQANVDFLIPGRGLYADVWKKDDAARSPAFTWGTGVALPALVAAARVEPSYIPRMVAYANALDVYWVPGDNGVPGYDVLPGPKSPDRYYDDNAWLVLAMADVYDITKDTRYRDRAVDAFKFVMSGEDDRLGGGIYWHEQKKDGKNTCVVAPAIVCAMRLYAITRQPEYLPLAKTLYTWTNAHLQDTDGLYFDNIRLDGQVERTKWTYNTALMIRANCLLYLATRDHRYLDEAERVSKAAVDHWIKPVTGAIGDGGQFAHLLSEAWLDLYDIDHDVKWLTTVRTALGYVHTSVRDSNGRYGGAWDKAVTAPLNKVPILNEFSVIRGFLFAAEYR